MARDPNERIGPGQFLETPDDIKALGVVIPQGFVVGTGTGQYYAHYNVHADGHTTVEWYKRGAGGGGDNPDPIDTTTAGPPATTVKAEWDKDAQTAATAAGRNVKSKYQGVFPEGHPRAGRAATITEYESGEPDYVEVTTPAATASARPPETKDEGGRRKVWRPNPGGPDAGGEWVDVGPAPPTAAERAADPAKPAVAAGTLNTTSPQYATVNADGSLTWAPNPNYQKPTPAPLNLPPTQKHVVYMNPDGTTTVTTNPNYQKPSKIDRDPNTGKLIEITEDDNGKLIVRDVTVQSTVKPADLPVLQSKYGEIAQGLGALAADLNGRVARGEMTPQERTQAFQAAHQQAETQVSELNGILSNSRAVWGQQIEQRGQTLSDTAGRRTYAGNVLGQAISYGSDLGRSAGPGHGKEITGGMLALMEMGQRIATGMGGLRDSPEIQMPAALQQAQGIGLPGYGGGPPGGGPSGSLPGPGAVPPGSPGVPPSGISDTTDRGGVPREMTPGSATNAPSALVGAPGSGAGLGSNITPPGAGMQQQLQAGLGFGGSPVAAGGQGLWDPDQEMASMVGDGSDAEWAAAVQAAARDFRRPAVGSGVESGYRRFG